jgi:predicted amidophosphoribosyltransferase
MYCPNCSAEAPREQKFCRSCGLELEGVAGLISGQNIAKPATPKQTPGRGERAMLIWGMILSLAAQQGRAAAETRRYSRAS